MNDRTVYNVPKKMRDTFETVTKITDEFCRQHLDEEYAELAREMTATLSRKRPSPLERGRAKSWAAGVLYALAQINFLFDQGFEPYMMARELCERIGVSQSTASNKAQIIREGLDTFQMDPEWTVPSMLEDNVIAWTIEVDGLLVDARKMPRHIQEEAYRKGLIPYVPDESPSFDPRSMEKMMGDLSKVLDEQNFESMEAAEKYLDDMVNTGQPLPEMPVGDDPLDRAQELIFEAYDASSREEAVALARKAVEISPDCADAYVLLGELEAETIEEALEYYKKGLAAGERALGSEMFREEVGHFWGIWETRPYMRARQAVAQALLFLGDGDEAIEHFRDMLRLNPNDNQGNRYLLADVLLLTNREEELEDLIQEYPDDLSANWLYNRALALFRLRGEGTGANRALEEALEYNPYVPDYLLGREKSPDAPPEYMGFGDESEAEGYVYVGEINWNNTPGALDWLKSALPPA
jgi:tetratricopeptide (TPR) repeat protein